MTGNSNGLDHTNHTVNIKNKPLLIIGYFTSRPALKGYVREMNNLLQVCTQIEALGFGTGKKMSDHTTRYLSEHSIYIFVIRTGFYRIFAISLADSRAKLIDGNLFS